MFSHVQSAGRISHPDNLRQYERKVIAERIRDKVAAAKRRGKYCAGVPILGYDVDRESGAHS